MGGPQPKPKKKHRFGTLEGRVVLSRVCRFFFLGFGFFDFGFFWFWLGTPHGVLNLWFFGFGFFGFGFFGLGCFWFWFFGFGWGPPWGPKSFFFWFWFLWFCFFVFGVFGLVENPPWGYVYVYIVYIYILYVYLCHTIYYCQNKLE